MVLSAIANSSCIRERLLSYMKTTENNQNLLKLLLERTHDEADSNFKWLVKGAQLFMLQRGIVNQMQ
jgi:hypothetical protein